jgi:hypothetical protein
MTIAITDLTAGTLDGSGDFDKLMVAVKAHLTEEYTKGRIKGPEFSTVYLGALQAVLAQAADFLLRKDIAHKEGLKISEEILVLTAQKCKLEAEYDVLLEQKLKTIAETALLNQKKVTEQAQTSGTGVDADSVIGKQKGLYTAQTDGFARDAEQKAAKVMGDTWNVRRTTDEGTVADGINMLSDVNVGRAITKLLDGVNA